MKPHHRHSNKPIKQPVQNAKRRPAPQAPPRVVSVVEVDRSHSQSGGVGERTVELRGVVLVRVRTILVRRAFRLLRGQFRTRCLVLAKGKSQRRGASAGAYPSTRGQAASRPPASTSTPTLYTLQVKTSDYQGLVDDNVQWTKFIDSALDDYESLKQEFWTKSQGEAKLRVFHPNIRRKPIKQYYLHLRNHRNKCVADIQIRKLFPGITNECPIREDACELANDFASGVAKTMELLNSPMCDFR
ncbi:hypothetical protein QAD02_000715 [Eretmocerus hayati]|uniref:Uncharacterized protein n=1 Tax=Eretmocerus hayati TaxID=131215 RepID=A0ACC2NED5_9HYME|nr:hypothetical protein QAD02_000715 [Eretmocerus hayati]